MLVYQGQRKRFIYFKKYIHTRDLFLFKNILKHYNIFIMVIEWGPYIDRESQKIIYHILMNTDINTVYDKDLRTILMAAREKSLKGGEIVITNGIHTNFTFYKKASEYGSFVPFWFDIEGTYKGEEIIVDDNNRMHVYVAKYMLTQDQLYNMYWTRVQIEPDEKKGYSPVYTTKTMYLNELWGLTGTVTGNFYRDEEIIMNGGGPHTKSIKKIPKDYNKNELPEEKIPVILLMPQNKKQEDSFMKKFKKTIMDFKESITRKK